MPKHTGRPLLTHKLLLIRMLDLLIQDHAAELYSSSLHKHSLYDYLISIIQTRKLKLVIHSPRGVAFVPRFFYFRDSSCAEKFTYYPLGQKIDFSMTSLTWLNGSFRLTNNLFVLASFAYKLAPSRLKHNRNFAPRLNWGLSFVLILKFRSTFGVYYN